tara:strand:- start:75 stop:740 length:666 start_codon:yes stop_codon:yes gene_type:complete
MRCPLLVILLSFLFISCEEEDNSPFYVAKNGVTIKARDWVTVGTTAELNGVIYTAVDLASLKEWIYEAKDLSKVVTTKVEQPSISSLAVLFGPNKNNISGFTEIKGIEGWDVSNWTTMDGLFYSSEKVNVDLSGWDVSQVTVMGLAMQLGDVNININNWDVSNVTSMTSLFIGANNSNYIEGMDLSGWDVSEVVECSGLTSYFDDTNWPESKRPNFKVDCN